MDPSDQSCPPSRNIKLTIQYNGTKYHGWQRQVGQISIQEVIQAAIEKMTGEQVCLIGSGRTDAGVHALAQVTNFHTDSKISLEGFLKGLNSLLPEDIAILAISEASPDFHSIRNSICKIYCYHILVSDTKIPFWNKRAWLLNRSLDIHSMETALPSLIGTHDFSAFKASGSNAKTGIRTIYLCEIKPINWEIFPPSGGLHYMFTVAADGFLRYMVRNIVGLLVQIGLGTKSYEDMANVIASKDRSSAGPTAPPQGLYLKQVYYDKSEIPFVINDHREEQQMSWTLPLAERVRNLKPSPTLAVDTKAKTLKAQGVDIINLSAGEPDFDTPEHIKEAAIKAIRDGFTKYTPVGGIPELKEAIAAKIEQDYKLTYRPEQIMVSTGGKQVLYNVAQAILDPGDEVIIPVPYWVSYPAMVELAGGKVRFLPSDPDKDFALDLAALGSMLTSGTKAIILNSPSNPTGAVYSRDDLKTVADLAVKHNFVVITDDIYDQIRFGNEGPENIASVVPEAQDHVVVVNGVSKTYAMTGWRIGYLAGPEAVVKAATKIQSQSTSNPNSIAQKATLAALTGPQDGVLKMKQAFFERKNYIMERLRAIPGISCVEPKGAFYVFPDLSSYYGKEASGQKINDSLDMADYLLEKAQIAGVPGVAFGDDRFMRFSYATDLSIIQEGMDRLSAALSNLK